MLVQPSSNFVNWADGHLTKAKSGDAYSLKIVQRIQEELDYLIQLPAPPTEESATLRRVRQSKKYTVWRVSHAYDKHVAVRIICWFDPNSNTAVVALFGADKKPMGDVFYDSVGSRSDQIIDRWKRQQGGQQ